MSPSDKVLTNFKPFYTNILNTCYGRHQIKWYKLLSPKQTFLIRSNKVRSMISFSHFVSLVAQWGWEGRGGKPFTDDSASQPGRTEPGLKSDHSIVHCGVMETSGKVTVAKSWGERSKVPISVKWVKTVCKVMALWLPGFIICHQGCSHANSTIHQIDIILQVKMNHRVLDQTQVDPCFLPPPRSAPGRLVQRIPFPQSLTRNLLHTNFFQTSRRQEGKTIWALMRHGHRASVPSPSKPMGMTKTLPRKGNLVSPMSNDGLCSLGDPDFMSHLALLLTSPRQNFWYAVVTEGPSLLQWKGICCWYVSMPSATEDWGYTGHLPHLMENRGIGKYS